MKSVSEMTMTELQDNIGILSTPSKMAGTSWSISAALCLVGGVLKHIAGSVCSGCYAERGQYIFPSFKKAAARRWRKMRYAISFESSRERFISSFSELLTRKRIATEKRIAEGKKVSCDARYHRWFDAGDLQPGMLPIICEIGRRCPEVQMWLPTREWQMVIDEIDGGLEIPINIAIRISAHWPNFNPIYSTRLIAAGCYLSGVHTEKGSIPETMGGEDWSFFECPAHRQDNACDGDLLECRACYACAAPGHKTIAGKTAVSYPLHGFIFAILMAL